MRYIAFFSRIKITIMIAVVTATFLPVKNQAQSYDTQRNQILAYNILLNGVVAGVGGAIHKSPGEKTWKVFLKNFGKGSLGGLVKYSAKYQAYYLRYADNTFLAHPNRLFFFFGHSMVMNASLNQKLMSKYYCNLYGMDMVMNFENKDDKFLQARLSIATVVGFANFLIVGHEWDLYKSLEYGLFYFRMNPYEKKYGGFATFNCISIHKNAAGEQLYRVIPHEFVHTYQFYDFHPVSNLYTPAMKVKYEKYGIYRTLSKYLKADYEVCFQGALYLIQPKPRYYKNFFEFEAQHFNIRSYIKR